MFQEIVMNMKLKIVKDKISPDCGFVKD